MFQYQLLSHINGNFAMDDVVLGIGLDLGLRATVRIKVRFKVKIRVKYQRLGKSSPNLNLNLAKLPPF